MDAFGGLGQFKKDPSKMTLAERQKQQQASKAQAAQQWSGLDALGSLGASLPAQPVRPAQPVQRSAQPAPSDLLDDFFSPRPQATSQGAVASRVPSGAPPAAPAASLLDDFDVFTSAPPTASTNLSANASTSSFASAQAQAQAQARPSSTHPPNPRTSQDHEIAQLVDMGFSDEDAARALGEMGSVKGAINFLMCEAQGRPVPKPKPRRGQEDVYALAADVGQQVFATASSWFSKGKKQLQKQLDQWDDAGSSRRDDGQPAWMRSQERHRRGPIEPQEHRERFEEELPQRPRPGPREPPREPQAQSQPAPPKSRAELFRERQSQRGSGERGSGEYGAPSAPSGASSAHGSSRASPAAPAPTKATPTPPPSASVDLLNMSAPSAPQLSSAAHDMVATARASGNDAFKRGDYAGAATYFGSSLASVPRGHLLRTLLLSNRAAAFLKVGDAHAALADCSEAHEIMGPVKRDDKREAEAGKPLSDVWVKIVTRQAQAYEHLEKYPEALAQWKLLLDNGYSQPTFLDGKRRCIKAVEVKSKPQPPPRAPEPRSQRRGWGTTGAGPSSKEGKAAVEKVRNLNNQQAQSDKERGDLLVSVQAKVEAWKTGKDKDLRALLSSLQTVLPSWPPVAGADLVAPKKCRVVYMKAVARTHPDKVPASANTETKMVAESVFIVLNGAWEVFRVQNGL